MKPVLRAGMLLAAVAIAAGAGYRYAQLQHDAPVAPSATATTSQAGPGSDPRTILYYRNPMGLPDTSPVPKKDSMGMDYLPVYADDRPDDSGAVIVSPARIQTLGVKTALVELRTVDAAVRVSGRIEVDERAQAVVAPRFEGWIERLHVSAVGDPVRRGQPLFTAYSPELQSTGEELRIAERLASQSAGEDPVASGAAQRLAEATRARLRNFEVGGQTGARHVFHAPVNGIVLEKTAIQGGRFMPGETLFRIADLSKVWVIADVYERDLPRVRVGQTAAVTLDAYPDRRFEARVAYLYPTLNPATRSAPVRLEMDNRAGLLRPGMFAQLALAVGAPQPRPAVPASAVIDDGEHRIVLLALGEGRFRPQPVTLGERGRDFFEVVDGLREGDRVVVAANFLIDSESQLKAALSSLVEPDAAAQSPSQAQGPTAHDAEGTLDAIDPSTGSVTITHGEIPALKWPPMTMDFTVADAKLTAGLAPGTPIRFTFATGAPGEFVIRRIEAIPGDARAASAGRHGQK